MKKEFKPGKWTKESGIYLVIHDTEHTPDHEVTLVKGKRFRQCRKCRLVRFRLIHAAPDLNSDPNFQL